MNKRQMKKIVAFLLTAVMTMSMMSVSAFGYSEVAAPNNVTVDKYLVLEDDAKVPNAEFTISAKKGATVIDTDIIKVAPTDTTVDISDENKVPGFTGSGKYVLKQATLDLSSEKYSNPGVYSYTISIDDLAQDEYGITKDASILNLDIYVIDKNGSLEVASAVIYEGDEAKAETKTNDFVSTYASSNLTLSKTVSGNQGNRNDSFTFNVTVNAGTGCAKDVITVDNTTATLTESGVYTGTHTLKHGESVEIKGLAANANVTYEIVETAAEGYTTKYQIGEEAAVEGNTASGNMAEDVSVQFENSKEGTIPTGIFMTFAPYILMVIGAIAIGFVFLRRKQREC